MLQFTQFLARHQQTPTIRQPLFKILTVNVELSERDVGTARLMPRSFQHRIYNDVDIFVSD